MLAVWQWVAWTLGLLRVGTVSSHGGEAVVQAVPPPNRDPLSAVLRTAAVQASSGGWIECRLANADREQACRPRLTPTAAKLPANSKWSLTALGR